MDLCSGEKQFQDQIISVIGRLFINCDGFLLIMMSSFTPCKACVGGTAGESQRTILGSEAEVYLSVKLIKPHRGSNPQICPY